MKSTMPSTSVADTSAYRAQLGRFRKQAGGLARMVGEVNDNPINAYANDPGNPYLQVTYTDSYNWQGSQIVDVGLNQQAATADMRAELAACEQEASLDVAHNDPSAGRIVAVAKETLTYRDVNSLVSGLQTISRLSGDIQATLPAQPSFSRRLLNWLHL